MGRAQVAHGILTAMERERKRHAVVMLVYRVFCGELDEATWRYTMSWRQVRTHTRSPSPKFVLSPWGELEQEQEGSRMAAALKSSVFLELYTPGTGELEECLVPVGLPNCADTRPVFCCKRKFV